MASERDPLLTSIPENSQPLVPKQTKQSLEKPVFIVTSDVEDEPERKLIILRDETRKR